MLHGSIGFRLLETNVFFSEINQGVCFAKADRMLLTIYIKVDDETAIGVNTDASLRSLSPDTPVNVVRFGDPKPISQHFGDR